MTERKKDCRLPLGNIAISRDLFYHIIQMNCGVLRLPAGWSRDVQLLCIYGLPDLTDACLCSVAGGIIRM